MKIIVDTDLCESNGVCVKLAPEVFRFDEDDNLLVDESAAEAQRATVEKAVARCPRGALALEG